MLDIQKGFMIQIKQQENNQSDLLDKFQKDSNFLAIVGNSNTGKSFFASRLSGKTIPSGYTKKIQGLCMVYVDEENKCDTNILDTKGMKIKNQQQQFQIIQLIKFWRSFTILQRILETDGFAQKKKHEMQEKEKKENSINYFNIDWDNLKTEYSEQAKLLLQDMNNIQQRLLEDQVLCEQFLQRFVMEISPHIIVMVGRLQVQEQKLIKFISNKYKDKQIIIIHNYQELKSIEEVEIVKENEFSKCLNLVQRNQTVQGSNQQIEIYQDESNQNNPIKHLILAYDHSPSGKKYNALCVQHIKQILIASSKQKGNNLFKSLNTFISKNLHEFVVDLKQNEDYQFELMSQDNLETELQQSTQYKNYLYQSKILKQANFKLKPYAFDLYGDLVKMQANSDQYAPLAAKFKNKNFYIILLQIDNSIGIDVRIKKIKDEYYLFISGERKKPEIIENLTIKEKYELLNNQIKFGKFNFQYSLCSVEVKIDLKNKNIKKNWVGDPKDGIYQLKIEIINDDEDEKSEATEKENQ